jgi:hypothetical protein
MANYKVIDADQLDSDLTSVADSIRTKGGTTAALAFPEEFKAAIEAIETGGGGTIVPVSSKEVNFRDYDGTVLYSYTAEEAVALTELPPLPTHPGLVCQEWNWSLSDMQTYASQYGRCEVGATYITDDGKTRLYIRIAGEGRTTVPICFNQTAQNGVTVDWGDGSETQTEAGTGKISLSHTYARVGDYVITMDVASNCTLLLGADGGSSCVMGALDDGGCCYRNMLKKVEIGKQVARLGHYTFKDCYSLKSITIPNSVTATGQYALMGCCSLESITIPSTVKSIQYAMFYECRSLAGVVLPNRLNTVAGSSFYRCCSLESVVFPNNIEIIDKISFDGCGSLTSVAFPSGITKIYTLTFRNCYGVAVYDFTLHTAVPELREIDAFSGIASDCVIKVPAALADEWKAATNWSTYASYIVGV